MHNKKKKAVIKALRSRQSDLYRFAYSYVKNEADALDVVQETAIKALKNYQSIKDTNKVKTWLFTIIRNTALTLLKQKKNKQHLSLGDVQEISVKESIEKSESIYLKDTLKALEDWKRELIVMKFFENLTFEEIASILETNVSTVKSRYYKVIQELKSKYERSAS